MITATWTTAHIPAWALAAGDDVDFNGRIVALDWATATGPDRVVYGSAQWGSFNVDQRSPVRVHVPTTPVDGYNLWQPLPGTWTYSGCTCVHRRLSDGSWEPIGRDCPACTAEITDGWDD